MIKRVQLEIEVDAYFPPRRYGRTKSINNDNELIARALSGIENGQFKNYSEAARILEPEAIQYGRKLRRERIGDTDSRVQRLQRKIGKAYKDKYGHRLRSKN